MCEPVPTAFEAKAIDLTLFAAAAFGFCFAVVAVAILMRNFGVYNAFA